MNTINWSTSKKDGTLIDKVVDRAVEEYGIDKLHVRMDLIATHNTGCPLDFKKLLAFKKGSFGHDIHGINRFLNRDTGKLTQHFLPRCAKGV